MGHFNSVGNGLRITAMMLRCHCDLEQNGKSLKSISTSISKLQVSEFKVVLKAQKSGTIQLYISKNNRNCEFIMHAYKICIAYLKCGNCATRLFFSGEKPEIQSLLILIGEQAK